jgi:transcriptional regulator with XRE-family HTH domain
MKFPQELTKIMQKRGITAQDISQLTNRNISVADIRRYQNGFSEPKAYQIRLLNKILGIDFELILNPSPKEIVPIRQLGISISESGEVKAIKKPGEKIKTAKIKNSITRIHKIPKPGELICGNCFQISEDGRYCHPEDSEIKMMLGGPGTGEKSPDEMVAMLCEKCRIILDKKPNNNASRLVKLEHSMLWSKAIIFSQAMRIAELENKK